MIKIEVVKFQAQDVITASSVPATQLKPACVCEIGDRKCFAWYCPAETHVCKDKNAHK